MLDAAQSPLASQQAWTTVRRFMELTCGVVLAEDQSYLLEARLAPVARHFKFAAVPQFVAAACASTANLSSPQALALVDAMTTHETFFFRDASFWRVFEEQIVPEAARSLGGRHLRVWSAACSTGQEPYTIAMLLTEKFPELAATVEIIATDISQAAIDQGRNGVYSTLEVNRGLGGARLVRHFERHPGGFRIKDALRSRVTWSVRNLVSPQPPPRDCQVVLCRNVLIYFGERDKKTVVQRLHEAAFPGGAIGVGSSELLPGAPLAPGWYRPAKHQATAASLPR